MFKKILLALTLALVVLAGTGTCFAGDPPKPDPSGASIGTAADVVNATSGAPSAEDMEKMAAAEPLATKLADVIGHNRIAINMTWVLICGFLVMFMQAGFALAETGFTRAKNAGHTMGMNMMVYAIGMLGFWICGFALQMGGSGGAASLGGGGVLDSEFVINLFGKDFGLFGTKGFFLGNDVYDGTVLTMFLFQMVFMDTTATIPTGSMAERWTMKHFCVYGFFISMFVYPLYANWVWGGGWLSQLGANFGLGHGLLDFAGSSVVHMTGGVAALAGAIAIGPRLGKFRADGTANAIPGHHIPMAIAGCLILAFGWFGFNAGSTLAGGDMRIGVVAANTMLASAGGAMTAMLYMWIRFGKPDISMAANGLLAGLVAITAPCAFVTPIMSVVIGGVGGMLLCISVLFIENVLKIDDPVGAISVHGVNGAWGMLALGLFADGTYGDGVNGVKGAVTGLFYGDASQLFAQLIGITTNIIFVFVVMFIFFKVSNKFVKMRVAPEIEQEGLDMAEVAVIGYPEFSINKTHR
ncbi:MAG: ammonium transporter [Humidesulfovibrio sp.]|uniref:ammonium transporter n=1 Tax=Humidesulfovibrio sp. TaxID=2910988 RepID=UPI0027EF1C83|nr:ammonium transporter [Humidesulfovibrio sp.]MDQ7834195.1 ammonium transporter [Humidesulfovibrio sp.]